MNNSVFSIEEAGVNLILVDSNLTRNHDLDGKMDVQSLEAHMSNNKNIIFMHHPPCPQDGVDRSVINSKELIATRSNFIFYGHQHGSVKVPDFLKVDTDIHSVGTLLKKEKGASNEFVLLDISNGRINFAYRYIYNGNFFVANLLFPSKTDLKSEHVPIGKPNEIKMEIMRKLKRITNHNDNADNEYLAMHELIGEDIFSVIKEHSCLLIIGDAGMGKSYELANIYWNFEKHEDYFPVWINLRNTNYSKVKNIVSYAQNNTIDRKIPFLIIDGLDEMSGDKISEFINDLGAAIYGNPEVKIILSTRTNFKVRIDDFSEYKLLPLKNDEIKKIASDSKIEDISAFWRCLDSTGCLALARIPFYLINIIQIYSVDGTLPKDSELLDRMITFRFKKGDQRHPCAYKETLMGNEYELRSFFKELGFIMQSLHENSLDNKYYTRFFSSRIREFFNRSGLIICKENEYTLSWEFEHNIFREFLVADYLSELPFKESLKIITFDQEETKLRPSWVNTVAFLLSLRKENDLKLWLIYNAKNIIYEFESDRLMLDERNKVFIAIMQDCFEKCLPVYSVYSVDKLARYFQSEETIEYMITVLQKPLNQYAVLSVVYVLEYCTSFFGKEQIFREIILELIKPESSEYLVSHSIKALSNIFSINLPEVIKDIYPLIINDNRPEVVGTICYMFANAYVADEYSDFIFAKLETMESFFNNYHCWDGINNSIRTFNKPDTIIKAIDWLCNTENIHDFYKHDELFDVLIVKALTLFQNGSIDLLNNLIFDFAIVAGKCDKRKSNVLKQFFIDSDKLADALEGILKLNLSQLEMMYAIEDIMEPDLTEILNAYYVNDEVNAEIYKWYARRLPQDSPIFEKLNKAVIEKEGYHIQRKEINDWNKIRKEGDQRYFDSLFDKNLFNSLIKELLDFLDARITCEQLLGDSFSNVPHDRQDMQNIRTAIYHWGRKDCPLLSFVDSIDWNIFSISEICRMLKNSEPVEVSFEQEKVIKLYYEKNIEEINFELLNENNPECNLLYWHTKNIIFLMSRHNFTCSDEKLLEMVMLPWYVFESSTSTGESEALKFISEKISNPNKLRDKIIDNIKKKNLPPLAAQTHILYCLEHKLPDAKIIAVENFHNIDKSAKGPRNTAVDYLIALNGNKFVDNLIDKSTDNDLLRYLAYKMKNDCVNLITRLVEENKNSEDNIVFLAELIKLNNKYALETYIELVREANTLPDLHSDDARIPEITMAIREIDDISLIKYIAKLLVICFSEEFIDKQSFGLRDSLENVINNMIQIDKISVKKMLLELINQYPENDRLRTLCNWHLINIDRLLNSLSDSPCDVENTIAFIKNHRVIVMN